MTHQHFEIKEQRYGKIPMVDVLTWFGESNKVGISVYTQNLPELRDAIDDYLDRFEAEEESVR